jgi:hypothetical protein
LPHKLFYEEEQLMASDIKKVVEQVAKEADATKDEPTPEGATATYPNRPANSKHIDT